jgi:hypothetical protein
MQRHVHVVGLPNLYTNCTVSPVKLFKLLESVYAARVYLSVEFFAPLRFQPMDLFAMVCKCRLCRFTAELSKPVFLYVRTTRGFAGWIDVHHSLIDGHHLLIHGNHSLLVQAVCFITPTSVVHPFSEILARIGSGSMSSSDLIYQ